MERIGSRGALDNQKGHTSAGRVKPVVLVGGAGSTLAQRENNSCKGVGYDDSTITYRGYIPQNKSDSMPIKETRRIRNQSYQVYILSAI